MTGAGTDAYREEVTGAGTDVGRGQVTWAGIDVCGEQATEDPRAVPGSLGSYCLPEGTGGGERVPHGLRWLAVDLWRKEGGGGGDGKAPYLTDPTASTTKVVTSTTCGGDW